MFAASLLAGAAPQALAGAWTQPAGGWFLKLGIEQWETRQRFDLDANRVDYLPPRGGFPSRGDYRNQAVRLYAEYGLTDAWTVTAATAIERARARGYGQVVENSGLSDVTVQLKRRLLASPLVVSASAEAKIPTGYDVSHAPALGSGRVDGGARLAVGRGLGALYLSGETGYRARSGRNVEVPFSLEAGLTLMGHVMIRGELSGVGTPRMPVVDATFDPAGAESRYVTGGVGLVLLGDPLDLVFGAEHVLTGRNSLAGTRFTFSIWRSE